VIKAHGKQNSVLFLGIDARALLNLETLILFEIVADGRLEREIQSINQEVRVLASVISTAVLAQLVLQPASCVVAAVVDKANTARGALTCLLAISEGHVSLIAEIVPIMINALLHRRTKVSVSPRRCQRWASC
jgi:hypothetical protein